MAFPVFCSSIRHSLFCSAGARTVWSVDEIPSLVYNLVERIEGLFLYANPWWRTRRFLTILWLREPSGLHTRTSIAVKSPSWPSWVLIHTPNLTPFLNSAISFSQCWLYSVAFRSLPESSSAVSRVACDDMLTFLTLSVVSLVMGRKNEFEMKFSAR